MITTHKYHTRVASEPVPIPAPLSGDGSDARSNFPQNPSPLCRLAIARVVCRRLCAVVVSVRLSTRVDTGHARTDRPGRSMAPKSRHPRHDRAGCPGAGGVLDALVSAQRNAGWSDPSPGPLFGGRGGVPTRPTAATHAKPTAANGIHGVSGQRPWASP